MNILHKKTKQDSISFGDKLLFFQELRSIYMYGFNLSDSLENLSSVLSKKIKASLKMGKALSEVLAEKRIEPETVFLLEAAESSGSFLEVINSIINKYKSVELLKKKTIKALTYPLITLIFSLLIVMMFFIFIMPQFSQVYADFGMELPRIINFKVNKVFIILFNLICFFVIIINFEKIKEYCLYKLSFFKDYFLMNFLGLTSIVSRNNNDLAGFIDKIAGRSVYDVLLRRLSFYLKKGLLLSEALAKTEIISDVQFKTIRQAEYVNNVPEVIGMLALEIEESFFGKIEKLAMLLEPLLIIFIGLFIGFVALTILLPMMQLTQSF